MKVRIWCNNGANIHSNREQIVKVEDLGYDAEGWRELTDDEKYEEVQGFIDSQSWIEMGFDEIPD